MPYSISIGSTNFYSLTNYKQHSPKLHMFMTQFMYNIYTVTAAIIILLYFVYVVAYSPLVSHSSAQRQGMMQPLAMVRPAHPASEVLTSAITTNPKQPMMVSYKKAFPLLQ